MKKAIGLILLSVVLLLIISPTTTNALSCVEMPTGEQGYKEYDGIIVGHVEDVIRKKDNNMIQLKVIKSYKKIDVEQISVKEDITWGSLWGPSEVGEEYLFYLRESDSGWENPLCSPTMKIGDAGEELIFLQDKEVTIQRVTTPTELSPDDKTGKAKSTDESIPKPTSMSWIGIVIIGAVISVGGLILVLWRRWTARK